MGKTKLPPRRRMEAQSAVMVFIGTAVLWFFLRPHMLVAGVPLWQIVTGAVLALLFGIAAVYQAIWGPRDWEYKEPDDG